MSITPPSSTDTPQPSGDPLTKLPVDDNEPSNSELHIVNTLFKKHTKTVNILFVELKDTLILGILFIAISIPQVDGLIQKFIPATTNSYYMLVLVKSFILMALFWVIKHFYLAKK